MRRFLFAVLAITAVPAAFAAVLHVNASLIAGSANPAPDAPVWVGLKMHHDPGWHTYWKNPGDAGMPTRIDWTLPAGWTASGINWPAPERLPLGQLASYGYEGDIVLPVKLIPPSGWDAKSPAHVAARANWLVCKDVCIPEGANLALDLPARDSAPDRTLFEQWRARVPQMTRFRKANASLAEGRLVLRLEPAGSGQFFPEREELIEPGDPPQVTVSGDRVTWSAQLGAQGKTLTAPASIAGVWVPKSGRPVFVEAKLN